MPRYNIRQEVKLHHSLKVPGVYVIVNQVTNACYVGSTSNFYGRCSVHSSSPTNKGLAVDLEKYGGKNFAFIPLAVISNKKERYETEARITKSLRKRGVEVYNDADGSEVRKKSLTIIAEQGRKKAKAIQARQVGTTQWFNYHSARDFCRQHKGSKTTNICHVLAGRRLTHNNFEFRWPPG